MIAFEAITKVPIEFGAWFDPNIYQIAINAEVALRYLDLKKYCRIPKTIVIGVKPTIIYSKSLKFLISDGFKNENNIDLASTEYHVIFTDEIGSIFVLGYEVDNNLCDSSLKDSLNIIVDYEEVKDEL